MLNLPTSKSILVRPFNTACDCRRRAYVPVCLSKFGVIVRGNYRYRGWQWFQVAGLRRQRTVPNRTWLQTRLRLQKMQKMAVSAAVQTNCLQTCRIIFVYGPGGLGKSLYHRSSFQSRVPPVLARSPQQQDPERKKMHTHCCSTAPTPSSRRRN